MIDYSRLPDLPSLEEVEVKNTRNTLSIVALLLMFVLMLGPMTYLHVAYLRQYIPNRFLVLIGLMCLLVLWVIYRLVTADYHFVVDRTGVRVRGLIRRRAISWSEITGAEMSDTGDATIRLHTADGDLVIGPGLRYTEVDRLLASIWQHLRQIGKADRVRPTAGALTFWDDIPAPDQELHWGKRPHPARWLMLLFPLGMVVMTIWLLLSESHVPHSLVFFGPIVLMTWIMMAFVTREWSREVTRVVVRDDELEAETSVRTLRLPWSEIDFAQWGQYQLAVGSQRLHKILLIPSRLGTEDSERLILGIIRELRTAGKPQATVIPDVLRATASAAAKDTTGHLDPIETRTSRSDRVALVAMAVIFGAPMCAASVQHVFPGWLVAICTVVGAAIIGLIVWRICASYRLQANDDGISKTFLGKTNTIRWQDIAAIRTPASEAERLQGRRLLVNAKGKSLMSIPPSVGTAADRTAFTAYIEAKLSQTLPTQPTKPYLARPFGNSDQ